MKNKALIATNISDARDELETILSDLANDVEYSEIELKMALEHAYHHLNFAWHIRNEDADTLATMSAEDYAKWSKYPAGEISEYK